MAPRRITKAQTKAQVPNGKTRHRRATGTKRADYKVFPTTIKEYEQYNRIAENLREDELVTLYWQVTGKPVPVNGTANLHNAPLFMRGWYDAVDGWHRWLHRVIVMHYLKNLSQKGINKSKRHGAKYYADSIQFLHEPGNVPEARLLNTASIAELQDQGVNIMRSENNTTDLTPETAPTRKTAKRAPKGNGKAKAKETPATTKGRKTAKAKAKGSAAKKDKAAAATAPNRTPKPKAKAKANPTPKKNKPEVVNTDVDLSVNRKPPEELARQRLVAIKGADNVYGGWSTDIYNALCKAGAKGLSREQVLNVATESLEAAGAKRDPVTCLNECFLHWPRFGWAKVTYTKK